MVKYIYTYGDYKGESPTYRGTNTNDRAIDLCCGTVWSWTGSEWVLTDNNGFCNLYLGEGKTLAAILQSEDTVIPQNIQVHTGDDIHVPHNIRCTKNDLVINHNIRSTIRHAVVSYYDYITDCWMGPKEADTLLTTRDRCWSVWKNFSDYVIPFKSSVSLIATTAITSSDGSIGGGSSEDFTPIVVNKLNKIAEKLDVSEDGKLVTIEGDEINPIKVVKTKLITATDLDVNNRLLLENPPSYIISPNGTVIYMTSVFDEERNVYIVDFSGVSVDGIWKIIY